MLCASASRVYDKASWFAPDLVPASARREYSLMARSSWYVVQVKTGKEEYSCRAIMRASEDDDYGRPLVEECFSPTFVHRLKFHGEWIDVEKPLLPGYVVAVTSDPAELSRKMLAIPSFTRILTLSESFVPLREDERMWIEGFTKPDDRVVPISIGHREGDVVVITDGPLKGREAMIVRIIRKKCLAVLELHAGNKTITATVGLALLPKDESEGASQEGEAMPGDAGDKSDTTEG